MQHLNIRIGRTRYLLCEPQTTPDGKPTGYGNLVRHIEQTIRSGAAFGATIFLIKPRSPLNPALFDLESPDVRIIGYADWRAPVLRMLWSASAPLRYGKPFAWLISTAARQVRAPVELAKHWARRRGIRALDRWLDRLGHRCRRVSNTYEQHVVKAWQIFFSEARERARTTGSKRHRVRLRLRPASEQLVEKIAREVGVDSARPIVTLHVREAGYRTRGAARQRDLDAIREASIEGYAAAISWLTTRGYQVVRIGDPTMTPCRSPGVIDLATAPWRTGAFELWALLHSRFFMASDSGPYFLSKLCGIPCLSVNVFRLGASTSSRSDRYIVKRIFDHVRGRWLSGAEQLSEAFICGPLDLDRYEWIDNTPDEIREAVEDMVALLDDPRQPRTPAQARHDQLVIDLAARSKPDQGTSERLMFRRGGTGTMSVRFAARYLDSDASSGVDDRMP